MNQFKPGDTVVLKTGTGPIMVVESLDWPSWTGDQVQCVWWDSKDNMLCRREISKYALQSYTR